MPVFLVLSVTGGLYLFNDEFEDFAYSELLFVDDGQVQKTALPVHTLLTTALQSFPKYTVQMVILPDSPARTVELVLKRVTESNEKSSVGIKLKEPVAGWQTREENKPHRLSVFLNPYNGEIAGELDNSDRFMNVVKDLHGELLTGSIGTKLVELAACWAIAIVLTGLVLWFPRAASHKSVFYPRLFSSDKQRWRDLHAVTGFYFSIPLLLFLMSGLPWTDVWGSNFKQFKEMIGQTATTSFFDRSMRSVYPPVSLEPVSLEQVPLETASFVSDSREVRPIGVDAVLAIARDQDVTGKLKVKLPMGKKGVYTVQNTEDDPALQVLLQVDQYSGNIIEKVSWDDNPAIEKGVSILIKIHRGEYFGLANQLLGLMTALALVLICSSGIVMWVKRRKPGTFGMPVRLEERQTPKWMVVVTVLFGLFFPLLGMSLVTFYVGDFIFSMVRSFKKSQADVSSNAL